MVKQIEKYGVKVWSDEEMDKVRVVRCLCFRCCVKNCEVAKDLYEFCKKHSLALMVTRCPKFKSIQE